MATSSHDAPYRHYLREWRVYLGLGQEELARRAGTSKSVISRYETGDRAIRLEMQFTLMRALGIRPAQFFSPPTEPSLDAMVSTVSPDQRRRVVNIVKAALDSE